MKKLLLIAFSFITAIAISFANVPSVFASVSCTSTDGSESCSCEKKCVKTETSCRCDDKRADDFTPPASVKERQELYSSLK
jgi:hypothetical protein